jgi:hypothetical protein
MIGPHGDLCQVRDAQGLASLGHFAEQAAHGIRRVTTDPCVNFVKHLGHARGAHACDLDGKADTGKLSARGDFCQGTRGNARVGADLNFHSVVTTH